MEGEENEKELKKGFRLESNVTFSKFAHIKVIYRNKSRKGIIEEQTWK